jgi:hypothetical protein
MNQIGAGSEHGNQADSEYPDTDDIYWRLPSPYLQCNLSYTKSASPSTWSEVPQARSKVVEASWTQVRAGH